MKATFHGHACFVLERDGRRVIIDPFLTGNPAADIGPDRLPPLDAILLSHGHGDHLGDAVALSQRHKATIVATYELAQFCADQGATSHGMHIGGAHEFPFGYGELLPYYRWVEHTLPVQTAAMGTKEELFLRAATKLGLPTQTAKDISRAACRPQENAILQPHGTAGKTNKAKQLVYPRAKGCTFCGHCPQGCFLPLKAPLNLKAKRSTHVSYVPMALTADRWTHGRAATLVPDAFAVKVSADGAARSVTWRNTRTGALTTEEGKVVVLAAGPLETPRLWLNSGLPNPNDQVGRGLTDHALDSSSE